MNEGVEELKKRALQLEEEFRMIVKKLYYNHTRNSGQKDLDVTWEETTTRATTNIFTYERETVVHVPLIVEEDLESSQIISLRFSNGQNSLSSTGILFSIDPYMTHLHCVSSEEFTVIRIAPV